MFKFFSRLAFALGVLLTFGVIVAAPAFAQEGLGPAATSMANDGQTIGWAAFQGAPSITTGHTRFWVWNTKANGQNTLHIRTTSDSSSHTFTGTVSTNNAGNFYNLALFNGESDDSATPIGYNQFSFSFVTTSAVDGLDVDWSGRWLSLDLYIDGYHRPNQVRYGKDATAAEKLPLNVRAGKRGLLTLPLSILNGQTAFHENIADGYYIYRDSNGRYHLRLTTTKEGDVVDYRGRIVAEGGQFGNINVYKGDPRDEYSNTGDQVIQFRFITNGHTDGLDWTLSGGGLIFTLRMNGEVAAPNVSLGSNPFGTIKALTFRLVPASTSP